MADFEHSLGFDIRSEGALVDPYKYKNTGFIAGHKLSAPHFNWIIDEASKAITEIQVTHNSLETQFKSAMAIRNLHTYTSLSQIGLSGKVTMTDIFNALNMRGQCMLVLGNTNAEETESYVSDTPTQFGTLVVTHYSAARTMAQFWKADDGNVHQYIGKYHTTEGWSGWFETFSEAHPPTPSEVGAQPLHYYYEPSQIGCTVSSSPDEIWNALPNRSVFVYPGVSLTNAAWNFPNSLGTIRIEKYAEHRGMLQFFGKSKGIKDYRLYLDDTTGLPESELDIYKCVWREDYNGASVVPITNGGTGATTVADARKNLSFIGGSTIPDGVGNPSVNPYYYTGTGNSGSSSAMYNFDTGARGSNIVFISGPSYKGFLTPWGGAMFGDIGNLGAAKYKVFGGNAEEKASYSDGYIRLRTDSEYINASGGLYYYWCL